MHACSLPAVTSTTLERLVILINISQHHDDPSSLNWLQRCILIASVQLLPLTQRAPH
jgi:hypothetical protein